VVDSLRRAADLLTLAAVDLDAGDTLSAFWKLTVARCNVESVLDSIRPTIEQVPPPERAAKVNQ
jgi:hypothetical protein